MREFLRYIASPESRQTRRVFLTNGAIVTAGAALIVACAVDMKNQSDELDQKIIAMFGKPPTAQQIQEQHLDINQVEEANKKRSVYGQILAKEGQTRFGRDGFGASVIGAATILALALAHSRGGDPIQPVASTPAGNDGGIPRQAITEMTQPSLQERVTLDDIKGQPEAVLEVRRLTHAINDPEVYRRRGVNPPKGIMFVGPPGTGKTMLGKAIATECNARFVLLEQSQVSSKWLNESLELFTRKFNEVESAVRRGEKVILFMDEVDSFARNRSLHVHGEDVKSISALFQRLDGITSLPGVIFVTTTNRLEDVDPAVIRPGRTDKVVFVGPPNKDGRKETLEAYIQKARNSATDQDELFDPEIDIDLIADQTEGFVGAELASLINRALEINLDEEFEGNGWQPVKQDVLTNLIPVIKHKSTQ